jgi:tryptophan-rich sensory protein
MRRLASFVALTAGVAAAGLRATRTGLPWYRRLAKPSFQPPAGAFAPVWTLLYSAIAFSGWRVGRRPASPERSQAMGWWWAQLLLNGLWPWLFFARRRPVAALADSAALVGTIAEYVRAARRVDRPAARAVLPYLAWVGFATLLNAAIVRLNPRVRTLGV